MVSLAKEKRPLPMNKPTNALVVTCFPTYVPTYIGPNYLPIFLQNGLPKWNTDINSIEVHPQLSHSGRPVDVCASGCRFTLAKANWVVFFLMFEQLEQPNNFTSVIIHT